MKRQTQHLRFSGLWRSGARHAYKFASLLGKIFSELLMNGHTSHDGTLFAINRPALTDPNYALYIFNLDTDQR